MEFCIKLHTKSQDGPLYILGGHRLWLEKQGKFDEFISPDEGLF